MSLNRKLFSKSASDAAVCNSESLAPFGNEASYNKNVAVYQFEDNANDSSGNGYNGTFTNPAYVSGQFGKAASFDGSSSLIAVGSPIPNTDTDVSISAWVKLDSGISSNMHITGTGITSAGSEAPFRATLSYVSSNTFKIFALRQVGGTYYLAGTGGLNNVTINAGTWYHVVWSYNSTGRKLSTFLNGAAIDSGVAMSTSGSSVNDSTTVIGSFRSTSGPFFDGAIDQLRMYSKALTAEEVTTLYVDETTDTASSTTIIPGTSCLAYFPLDYDASDKSGNYSGTPSNVEFVENGKINYAARFDGSSSIIELEDNILQNSSLSVSMWFWGPPSTSGWNTLYNNTGYSSGSRFLGYYLVCKNDKLLVYTSNTSVGSDSSYTMSASYNIGAWNFIAMTIDSTNHLKLYLNGAAAESFTTGGYAFDNSYPMNVTIGARKSSGSATEWIESVIDEVRIFNKILSSDEVTTLYGLTACTRTCTTDTADFIATNLAYYKLDSDADDYHGGTHNGTASNLTYASGRFGSAGSFNGTASSSGSRVTIPQAIFSDGALKTFTISLWFKTGNKSATQTLISTYPYSSGTGFSLFLTTSGHLVGQFSAASGSGAPKMQYQTDMCDNLWHHAVLTYSSSGGTNDASTYLYVDGSDVTGSVVAANGWTQGSVPTWSSFTSNLVTIGMAHDSSTYSETMNGLIDQVRVFGSALTDTNVQDLYDKEFQCYITKDATNPFADSSEKAFYKFEESSGTTLTDSSGNGNNGTISGMTWTSTNPAFGSYSGSFDGTNDKVDLPDNILPDNSTASSSASIWFKSGTISGGNSQGILDSWDYDNSHPAWTLFIEPAFSGRPNGHIYLANYFLGGGAITGSNTYDDGNWHHAAVVFDQSENKLKLYIDGSLFGTETTTESNVWIFTEKCAIGYQNAHPSHPRYFNGQTDQCRIFNRALTGEEVWKLYAERNN